jgi:UDP-N-acetylmuramoyl-tripeptide--D-alanyl-D-alanine ligase
VTTTGLTLADVIEALTGVRPEGTLSAIRATTIDSRLSSPGSLFVALPGEHVDGHNYVGDAFHHGAGVALVQRDLSAFFPQIDLRSGRWPGSATIPGISFCLLVEDSLKALQQVARFWRRKLNLRVIGVTGSVGKSTTKELVYEVLAQRYHTLKNSGNLNNEIGLPLTVLGMTREHERAVLEMGFYYPGEISQLCDIALPQVGVITNIGTVHAERAGSQEAIARGKSELVQALPPSPEGTAILNYDDPWVRQMAQKAQARVFFYGLDPQADLWADGIESLGLEGIRFRLHHHNEVLYLRVPLIGRHSVHTALRAAAVGLAEGLSWQEIANGLRSGGSQLRLVAVHTQSGALILDDTYNASPESTLAALNLLADLEGHRIAVLGDMLELGPYEKEGHEMVGVRAAEVAAELIAIGPRARMIADAALQAGLAPEAVTWFATTQEATQFLAQRLSQGDVALIKGSRGMQMDAIVTALEGRS